MAQIKPAPAFQLAGWTIAEEEWTTDEVSSGSGGWTWTWMAPLMRCDQRISRRDPATKGKLAKLSAPFPSSPLGSVALWGLGHVVGDLELAQRHVRTTEQCNRQGRPGL